MADIKDKPLDQSQTFVYETINQIMEAGYFDFDAIDEDESEELREILAALFNKYVKAGQERENMAYRIVCKQSKQIRKLIFLVNDYIEWLESEFDTTDNCASAKIKHKLVEILKWT